MIYDNVFNRGPGWGRSPADLARFKDRVRAKETRRKAEARIRMLYGSSPSCWGPQPPHPLRTYAEANRF